MNKYHDDLIITYDIGAAMKTKFLLTILFFLMLSGCGKEEKDCSEINDREKREECAHKQAVGGNAIPPTLDPEPKKWRFNDGVKK